MRVLFVYPNLYTQMGFNHGLASLSTCLKRDGHETRLVNLNENLPPVPTREEILDLVRDWRPGLIGFSCLTQQYREGRELARWLRSRYQPLAPRNKGSSTALPRINLPASDRTVCLTRPPPAA